MLLRARVAIFLALLVGTTLALAGAATAKLMRIALLSEIQRDVARRAAILSATPPALPYRLDVFAAPDIFLQVVTRDGWPIASSGNLGGRVLPLTPLMRAGNVVEARVNARPLYLTAADLAPDRYIIVARSPVTIYAALRTLRRLIIIVTGTGILLVGLLSWVFAREALRPVEEVARAARQVRAGRDLAQRVGYVGPSDELGRLVATFNEMLAELEQAYRQLGESNESLRRFLADIAHELRAPLTLVMSTLELLRKLGDTEPGFRDRALQDIGVEASRMSRMITQLLILARADAGAVLQSHSVPLTDVVTEALRQARATAGDVTIELMNGDALHCLVVRGNEDYLHQLLLILLDNAVKYGGGRAIRLEAEVGDGTVRLAVADGGPGIHPDDLPRIFERFYRGRQAGSVTGAGLGLAIARWIVEQHGGAIEASSPPGEGARFTVVLPTA